MEIQIKRWIHMSYCFISTYLNNTVEIISSTFSFICLWIGANNSQTLRAPSHLLFDNQLLATGTWNIKDNKLLTCSDISGNYLIFINFIRINTSQTTWGQYNVYCKKFQSYINPQCPAGKLQIFSLCYNYNKSWN